ncbi:MAG: WYL domain-containing protein [Acidimicrobiaceae bacterium]|nr:WYL domain-containing protein [Acidimicrobiia bacterium]MCY4493606.1 WYL domain-containing protein [Acidimicrobiaceae bacterium]
MSPRLTAAERMTRLLAVIPWVVQQQGAPIDEIVARFDYPRSQLVEDLTGVVFFVGVHPFTPDSMIEVDISDDEVQISYADWFSRPLRLTGSEGARLLTAAHSLLGDQSWAGGDDEEAGPLLRALTKLSMALGEAAEGAVEVRLGDAGRETLVPLRSAVSRQEQVDIEYYTYGRDELTQRIVEPSRVFSDNGNWYLDAWCQRAGAQRVFRVDRIRSVRLTGDVVEQRPTDPAGTFTPGENDPRVVLRLHPDSAWVAEQYPTESAKTDEASYSTVSMAVSSVGWLERLMLRLGPSAEIVAIDAPLSPDLVSEAANRVLERYR